METLELRNGDDTNHALTITYTRPPKADDGIDPAEPRKRSSTVEVSAFARPKETTHP